MKERIDAKIEPGLLARIRAAVVEDDITLTQAVEEGFRLWLKSRLRRKKDVSE